jgi:hypothetical protein
MARGDTRLQVIAAARAGADNDGELLAGVEVQQVMFGTDFPFLASIRCEATVSTQPTSKRSNAAPRSGCSLASPR